MNDMTEIRHDANMEDGCAINLSAASWQSHVREMILNFDEIEKNLIESNNLYMDLQQICDDQASQIATLKAALIAERSKSVELFWYPGINFELVSQKKTEIAKAELASEYPDTFGDAHE